MDLKELLAGLDEDTIKTVTSTIEANATKNKAKVLISEGENQFVPQYRLDEVVAERNKQKRFQCAAIQNNYRATSFSER